MKSRPSATKVHLVEISELLQIWNYKFLKIENLQAKKLASFNFSITYIIETMKKKTNTRTRIFSCWNRIRIESISQIELISIIVYQNLFHL